ncbi:thioesterase family protein [Heyndrickxia oleronia]|uniref:Thioesterase n=2 Tax=Heyndrickxia oleronia TaxID=38875 RepID=A0AAW6SSM1_9BACI|nr:thioesterase [Heyndrickxia oleronia]MCI1591961.1 thioesterase [Heyndrickxia oleronia]MCI1613903.1 thioesterase [Heyndrickxia oleronia]MCI1745138.1 thioesterase [Heyndrickxia oleronia]MCI1760875.1 thioesterase [Heyndrickxia oleronia]MCM3239422.1 thioesterase [Heyndrickxia oleronia]
MKAGMEVGQTATIEFEVTPDMFAGFEGNVVHRAYSTVSMVYHMEWASRQIILPFLEEHEEGMGGAVSIKHIAPTTDGTKVRVKATLTEIKNNIVITRTEAWNEKGLIGHGEVKQAILPKEKIIQMIADSKQDKESEINF